MTRHLIITHAIRVGDRVRLSNEPENNPVRVRALDDYGLVFLEGHDAPVPSSQLIRVSDIYTAAVIEGSTGRLKAFLSTVFESHGSAVKAATERADVGDRIRIMKLEEDYQIAKEAVRV